MFSILINSTFINSTLSFQCKIITLWRFKIPDISSFSFLPVSPLYFFFTFYPLSPFHPNPSSLHPTGFLALSIALGYYHTCAIVAGSSGVKCWGNNDYGQLGIGSSITQYYPQDVDVDLGAGRTRSILFFGAGGCVKILL